MRIVLSMNVRVSRYDRQLPKRETLTLLTRKFELIPKSFDKLRKKRTIPMANIEVIYLEKWQLLSFVSGCDYLKVT